MGRTALTAFNPKGPYPGVVNPGDLSLTALDTVDNTNGNSFIGNGKDLLLIHNPTAAAVTVTLTSSVDPQQRLSNITAYSIPISGFFFFYFGSLIGWTQDALGTIILDASATGLRAKVVRIPQVV